METYPRQRNNSEPLPSLVHTAEPGSRAACGRPRPISLLLLLGLCGKAHGASPPCLCWLELSLFTEKGLQVTVSSLALNTDSQQTGGSGETEGMGGQGGVRFSGSWRHRAP